MALIEHVLEPNSAETPTCICIPWSTVDQCLLLSNNRQNVAVARLSAKCKSGQTRVKLDCSLAVDALSKGPQNETQNHYLNAAFF